MHTPPKGAARRRRWTAVGPAVALAALAVLALLLVATPAGAQSNADLRSQISTLRNQISNQNSLIAGLRDQLTDLERVVHTGAAPRRAAPDAPDTSPDNEVAERNSRRLLTLETEIDEAKEWQRRVTGRFEEIDNKLRRIEGRIEQLIADVDFRLAALEQWLETTPAAALAAPADGASAAEPGSQGEATIAPGQGTGYEPSTAPRDLGTIPAPGSSGDVPAAAPGQTPEEQYQAAFGLLEAARYEEAEAALSRFMDANPTSTLVQNAAYWRCETLYARQIYDEAARCYALNLRQFPDGRKAPDNMVKLGMALLKLGRNEEACRTFAQLDQTFTDPQLNIRRAAQQGRRQANCP